MTTQAGMTIPRWGWQERAACRSEDLELFFGHDGEPKARRLAREARAVEVCRGCAVRDNCLQQANQVPERYGVWGGLTEEQRQEQRRADRRRRAA